MMSINGQSVNVALDANVPPGGGGPSTGFLNNDSSKITFYHLTANCSGTRYMVLGGNGQYSQYQSYTVGNQSAPNYLFYPTAAPTYLATTGSYEQFSTGMDPTQPGTCTVTGPQPATAIVAVTYFDLSTLGFVPPFSLK